MKVRKAVIPAAGLGTRMLPVSKVVPKELLPVVDRPMLHYVVEEAIAAGLTQIILVTSRGKEGIADYFAPTPALELSVGDARARKGLADIRKLATSADFLTVRQEEQKGLGHAVLMAQAAVGDEPFAVLLPDTLVVGGEPAIGRLLRLAEQRSASAISVDPVPWERVGSLGVIDPVPLEEGAYRVAGLVEKAPPDKAPSNLAIVGRYVLTPDIFRLLEHTPPGARGEIQLTDGLSALLGQQPMFAQELAGKWHDTGTPLGLLQASVELALQRQEMAPYLKAWLRSLASAFDLPRGHPKILRKQSMKEAMSTKAWNTAAWRSRRTVSR